MSKNTQEIPVIETRHSIDKPVRLVAAIAAALALVGLIWWGIHSQSRDAATGTLDKSAYQQEEAQPEASAQPETEAEAGRDEPLPEPSKVKRTFTADKDAVTARMDECFGRVSAVALGSNRDEVLSIQRECFYSTQSLVPSIFQLNGTGALHIGEMEVLEADKALVSFDVLDDQGTALAQMECYWKDYANTCQPHSFELTAAGDAASNKFAYSTVHAMLEGSL